MVELIISFINEQILNLKEACPFLRATTPLYVVRLEYESPISQLPWFLLKHPIYPSSHRTGNIFSASQTTPLCRFFQFAPTPFPLVHHFPPISLPGKYFSEDLFFIVPHQATVNWQKSSNQKPANTNTIAEDMLKFVMEFWMGSRQNYLY